MGVEHRDRRSGQRGAHTRRPVGGPDPPQDRRGGVGPAELPVRLAHHRPQPAAHLGAAIVERGGHEPRIGRLDEDLVDELDRRVGHRPGVEAALAGRLGRVDREGAAAPDRSRVHLLDRLQRGHAPLALTVEDRPVQRGRAPVTGRPGMDDDRAMGLPDPGRHPLAQERTDDQIGLMVRDRGAHRLRLARQLNPDRVTRGPQLGPDPLAQAVEGRAEQHDPHERSPPDARPQHWPELRPGHRGTRSTATCRCTHRVGPARADTDGERQPTSPTRRTRAPAGAGERPYRRNPRPADSRRVCCRIRSRCGCADLLAIAVTPSRGSRAAAGGPAGQPPLPERQGRSVRALMTQ